MADEERPNPVFEPKSRDGSAYAACKLIILEGTMYPKLRTWTFLAIVLIVVLSGCASATMQGEDAYGMFAESESGAMEYAEAVEAEPPMEPQMDDVVAPEAPAVGGGAALENAANVASDMALLDFGQRTSRMIIKNAEISLLVEDTDTAIDRTTQIVDDVGGYIISSRVWYQDWGLESYKYSTITIGVPVDEFERTIRRLRDIAVKVVDENAYGEDVTDEYVDLESQLTNLEATRDRIKTFLDRATTVEEALEVNKELSQIEGQIEEIRGRMNYLEDRAAFSTITITISPDLPELIPTPTLTPTVTDTPKPTMTPTPWDASKTVVRAKRTLTQTYQGLFEMAIWVGLYLVPVLGPPVLVVILIWYFWKKRSATNEPSEGDSKK